MPIRSVGLHADVRNQLGEGTLWHPILQRLFWLDIHNQTIYWSSQNEAQVGHLDLRRTVSVAAWIDSERLLLAADDGLYSFSIRSGAMTLMASLEGDIATNRSNDGRCDPWGRFWIGTMDREAKPHRGAIYIFSDGKQPFRIRDKLTIPNSIAFSPDCRRGYYADTEQQTIFALDLDPESGAIVGESVFATTSGTEYLPDGSVVDAEGCLWNAQWDGWRVVRYGPDGKIRQTVEFPVQRPTCPAFGGPDMKTLYVASARTGLAEAALQMQPDAGGVFALRTEVPGIPEHAFGRNSTMNLEDCSK